MKTPSIFLKSFFSALGVFLVYGIVWVLLSNYIFSQIINSFFWLIPAFVFELLFFIVSACVVTGLLVARKLMEGHRKEAFILFFSTLGWSLIFFLLVWIASPLDY